MILLLLALSFHQADETFALATVEENASTVRGKSSVSEIVAAAQQEARLLEHSTAIERDIIAGQTPSYRLALPSQQYLRAVVNQQNFALSLKIVDPNGEQLAEIKIPSNGKISKSISMVTEMTGDYRLEISLLKKDAATGRYEVNYHRQRRWLALKIIFLLCLPTVEPNNCTTARGGGFKEE